MVNQEERKVSFEQCCLTLIELLEEEYKTAKSGSYQDLAVINEKKAELQIEFQDFLFQFSLTPRGIPDDIAEHINAVHKRSQRNAHFVCLQYGDTEKERKIFTEQCNQEIIYDPNINQLTNIDLFAHQVAAMDLIISTSNTTVHVAGGVGTTTWAIIPEGTGKPWYWFLDRKDCLWYPSVSFYRQKKSGDWHHPLTEINKTLSQWIKH